MNLFSNTIASVSHTAKYEYTAHFPGTGPAGQSCSSCLMFKDVKEGTGTCKKWVQLMRSQGLKKPKAKAISGKTSSCRYYEKNENYKVSKLGVPING